MRLLRHTLALLMVTLLPAVSSAPLQAQQTDDANAAELAALDLDFAEPADTPAEEQTERVDGKFGLEAALGYDRWRAWTFADAVPDPWQSRVSAQYRRRWTVGDGWSTVLDNRVDVAYRNRQDSLDSNDVAYTLSEAYVGYAGKRLFLDVGRFNERIGVAYAYNPTDVFRSNSVVARVSDDPSLLRSSRLGVVGLRAQYLYDNGSLNLIAAPRLSRNEDEDALSPHLARSNSDTRVMLRASRRLSEQSLVEAVALIQPGGGWQPGLNVSTLWGDHVVAYSESLMTREVDIDERSEAVDPTAPFAAPTPSTRYRPRTVFGISTAIGQRFTVVLEGQYDATALDRDRLAELGSPEDATELARYLRLRQYAVDSQSQLARRYLFARVAVARPFGENTFLTSFVRYNLEDDSRYFWLQAGLTRHAITWSATLAAPAGGRGSEFGDVQASNTLLLTMEWTR